MTLRRAATAAVVLGVVAFAVLGLVRAGTPSRAPSLQERVHEVAVTVRCPTCQGLSVADSTSITATGSLKVIQQQLEDGRTPDQIRQWFADRYGRSVLLSPDASGPALLAWLLPALGVLVGAVLVWRWLRRGRRSGSEDGGDPVLDPDAMAALADFRAGRLDPDASPAGEALREALTVRVAAAEDDADDASLAAADRRLAVAYRRYRTRAAATPASTSRAVLPGRALPRALPRHAVTVGAAAVALVAVGIGVGATVTGGGSAAVPARAAAATPSAPAGAAGGMPSPPAGWTGGMPQDTNGWVALGKTYDHAKQYDQAVAAYTMALRLQPDADAVALMRDDVLVRAGHPAQALADLQQLGKRYPDNPDVLLVLGLAQNRTGAAAAGATLRRFLQLAPDSPAAPGVRKLLGEG